MADIKTLDALDDEIVKGMDKFGFPESEGQHFTYDNIAGADQQDMAASLEESIQVALEYRTPELASASIRTILETRKLIGLRKEALKHSPDEPETVSSLSRWKLEDCVKRAERAAQTIHPEVREDAEETLAYIKAFTKLAASDEFMTFDEAFKQSKEPDKNEGMSL